MIFLDNKKMWKTLKDEKSSVRRERDTYLLGMERQKEDRLQKAPKEGEEAEPTQEVAKGICHIAEGDSCVAEGTEH